MSEQVKRWGIGQYGLIYQPEGAFMEYTDYAKLEAENKELQSSFEASQGRSADTIEKLEAENAALREALKKYGEHIVKCRVFYFDTKVDCTCGFDNALKAAEE